MNLASFADLAVRLVNSGVCDAEADPLRSCEAFRVFAAERSFSPAQVKQHDLDGLKMLRAELAKVFASAVDGDEQAAAAALNALLMVHPVHPELVQHDGQAWHVHLSESGTVTDRYASTAVIGLSLLVSGLGMERLGICAIASCEQVYIDGSKNKSRRYCREHSATKANVTALRGKRRISSGVDESVA
ncbi:MAG: ABATE domain-containing protein [Nocardiopsaceae bacterium]|nr:ABATE domain-containing protein [Nocardiopsaceae bacterium]